MIECIFASCIFLYAALKNENRTFQESNMAFEQILGHQKSCVAHLGNTKCCKKTRAIEAIEIVDLPIKNCDFS